MDKFKVQITKEFTDEEMEDIVVTALEGGIGYWACLDNATEDFKDQPKDTPVSEWCWQLLKDGKTLHFFDAGYPEDGEYFLDLSSLLDGIGKAIVNGNWDGDMDSLDALVADAIIQYAIFDDIIYG